MEITIISLIGWTGSILLVAAYGLLSMKKLASNSYAYQAMNLFGGLFLMLNTLKDGSFAASFVNIFWSLIALWSLFNIVRKSTSNK